MRRGKLLTTTLVFLSVQMASVVVRPDPGAATGNGGTLRSAAVREHRWRPEQRCWWM